MANIYATFGLTDERLIDSLCSIANELSAADSATLSLYIDQAAQKVISCKVPELANSPEIQEIRILQSSVLHRAHLSLPALHSPTVDITRDGTGFQVTVTANQSTPNVKAIQLLAATQKYFKPYSRDESFDKLLGNELAEFYRKREQGLLRLEELSQKLIEQNEDYRRRLDESAEAAGAALQRNYGVRLESLEKEHGDKSSAIDKRAKELDERIRALDDRSSKHARRQLREVLKEAIASRNAAFSLTKETIAKRRVIHYLFSLLITLFTALVIMAVFEQRAGANDAWNWYHFIKMPFLTLAAAASVIYYIRWNDHWFRRHADEEFNVKRFELDIDRASWVVEMAMEWKDEKGSELPNELLHRLTANLFAGGSSDPSPKHPTEDLASALLGASSEINLNIPNAGSVKLDRKGTQRFQQSLDGK